MVCPDKQKDKTMTTEQHLDAWLARNARDDEAPALREAMLQLVTDDEAYWSNQGWWRVHDAVVEQEEFARSWRSVVRL